MRKKQKIITRTFKMTVLTGMLIFLGILVKEYSIHSGLFETFEVQIKGNQFVNTSRIEERLTSYMTQSLLSLNLDDMQGGLSSLDFIKTVQISRLLPNILMIQIVESQPILLITIENENFLMDDNCILLPADGSAISFFPVPIITISNEIENAGGITGDIAGVFQFLLNDYPLFYDNLSEVIIGEEKWTFYSDSKTRIFTKSENLFNQLNILKNFEKTVYPNRRLDDYSYIDLRIEEQIIVKEKYRKG